MLKPEVKAFYTIPSFHNPLGTSASRARRHEVLEIAARHGVPIVEDPPLARALHASVEIDETIPAEHYKAVAKVIGYVLTLARKRA